MLHTMLDTSNVYGNGAQPEHLLSYARSLQPQTLILAGEVALKDAEGKQLAALVSELYKLEQAERIFIPEKRTLFSLWRRKRI